MRTTWRLMFVGAVLVAGPLTMGACNRTVAERDTQSRTITGGTKTEHTEVKEDILGNQTTEHEVHKTN